MTTFFNYENASKLSEDLGQIFPSDVYSATLAATTDTFFTVPGKTGIGGLGEGTNKFLAFFKYEDESDTFFKVGAAAGAPAGAGFAANASELAPKCRLVKTGDVLHFYSIGGGHVTVSFYAI